MKSLYAVRSVPIPSNCSVQREGEFLVFEGPLGEQKYDLTPLKFTFDITDSEVSVKCWHCNKKKLQLINTVASHVRNYMTGVTVGYKFVIRAVSRHFPINFIISEEGKKFRIPKFIGSEEEANYTMIGSAVAIQGDSQETFSIQGNNLQEVSQSAAVIMNCTFRRKKKDDRVFIDGFYILEKTPMVIN